MKKEQKRDNKKLYDFDSELKDKKKAKMNNKKADNKSASKKKKRNKEKLYDKNGQEPQNKKYDDEIIIGVTRYPEKNNLEHKKSKNKKQNNAKESIPKRRKNKINIEQYNVDINDQIMVEKETQKSTNKVKNKKKTTKIIKIILLLVLIVGAMVFALLSPIFNIQNIEIVGNEQITKEEIKSLSGIQMNDNIFKVRNKKVYNNIKQNAYIRDVKIHKILPNKIKLEIEERKPSYMLEYGNGYVYVNKQGYMLEISSIKKELPILIGTSTSKEDYKDGNRLNEEDLVKLGIVIKIMDAAQSNEIEKLITKIDVANPDNYTLYLETERKVAYLGDCSNLETRMLFLVGILDKEKDSAGEIFINMNLNTDDAFFRESV